MDIQLANIWVVAGVILGLEMTWFTWRFSREIKVASSRDVTWLPPADIVNLVAMVVMALGVFILPILGLIDIDLVKRLFALAVLLFVGHPFALAGHYDMYNPNSERSMRYFPFQEQIAIAIIGVFTIAYMVFAFIL